MSSIIEKIIREIPDLTTYGIGVYEDNHHKSRRLSEEERICKIKESRIELLQNTETFDRVIEWLKKIEKSKNINMKYRSNALKDIAERNIKNTYISNGIFI
ncbi:MAG: hypothetical protein PQJ58_01475 [Spirochaetales bacterium]|nr:hypothetical protein [Spirochaetales bacterium]